MNGAMDDYQISIPPTYDASRFGTIIREDPNRSNWTIVVPFNEKMRSRAYNIGARDAS